MLQIILQLLIALGISIGNDGSQTSILVIDQTTGESYAIGATAGVGSKPPVPTQVYMLVQDENGNYSLIRR